MGSDVLLTRSSQVCSSSPRFLFTLKTVTKFEPKRTRGAVVFLFTLSLHLPAVRKMWLKSHAFSFTLPRRKIVVAVGSVGRGQCTEDNNRHFTWLYTTNNSKSYVKKSSYIM